MTLSAPEHAAKNAARRAARSARASLIALAKGPARAERDSKTLVRAFANGSKNVGERDAEMAMTRTMVVAVLAGVAIAAPALPASARERQVDCPSMPPSADIERAGEGGVSLLFGGFGLSGNRSRSTSSHDIFMKYGGFEAWSAAVVLAQGCQKIRAAHPHDPTRQRSELYAMRNRILGRPPDRTAESPHAQGEQRQTARPGKGGVTSSWTFEQLWKPAARPVIPDAARLAGVKQVAAEFDCRLSRERGLDDCSILREFEKGYGFGAITLDYLRSLRLKDEVRRTEWPTRRISMVLIAYANQ